MRTHTHTNERGETERKALAGTCNTDHFPCKREGKEIKLKGISEKWNMSTSTEWSLDGWGQLRASAWTAAIPPSQQHSSWARETHQSLQWFSFQKGVTWRKTKSARESERTSSALHLTLIFPLCKQAWTWADILISVLRCLRSVCLYKAVFRLKLYDLLTNTGLKITLSTWFLSQLKLLQQTPFHPTSHPAACC